MQLRIAAAHRSMDVGLNALCNAFLACFSVAGL
jgi:hypothetical protein